MAANPFGELKTDYHFDTEAGVIVSEKHRRIAEIIHDYNPELSLMWIPPSKRSAEDGDPFLIVHTRMDGSQYPVMWIPEEQMDNPPVVLGRLFAGDMSKGDKDRVQMAMEAAEMAEQVYKAKIDQERWDSKMDFVTFALKTPLHKFKHNGKEYRS